VRLRTRGGRVVIMRGLARKITCPILGECNGTVKDTFLSIIFTKMRVQYSL
jgi:hypothetical protein